MSVEGAPALDLVAERAAAVGLQLRGAFHPEAVDGVPAHGDGRPAGTLVLLGNVGTAMWQAFRQAPERDQAGDGLDRWSERVVGALAKLRSNVVTVGQQQPVDFREGDPHAVKRLQVAQVHLEIRTLGGQ